jgi:hypothetical protein
MEEAGIALDTFLRTLLSHVRDLLHGAIDEKKPTTYFQHVLDVLLSAIRDVRIAPVPGLVVESALLGLCTEKESAKVEAPKLMKPKKEKDEEKTDEQQLETSTAEPVNTQEEKVESIKHASVEAVELSLESIKEVWPQVIRETTPASVKMSLKNGQILTLTEKALTLGFSSSFHRDNVANLEASRKIEEVMQRILKRSLRIECVIGDGEKSETAPEPAVDLAEAAAEIF